MAAGVGLLSIGSQLIVSGAVAISTGLGVSNLVVGLTVVAIGTSFPELATSLSALRRGEGDIALGNIVGSNIFNIGLVLGLPAIIFPGGIRVPRDAITMDLPILLAAVVLLTAFAFTGLVISRWEGALFFVLYLVCVSYLVLDSIGSEAAPIIGSIMVWFVLPALAAAVIAVFAHKLGVYRWVRSKFSRFVAKRPRKKPHRAE
jgi:cation:H+ antiporter